LARLDRRLGLLTGGPKDGPSRQRTLRAALDWSYQLLTDQERRLFRRLGAFAGVAELEAVAVVCADGEPGGADVLDLLESLVAKSLLRQEPCHEDQPRFGMLTTLREYAQEQLAASGEETEIGRRHAVHFAMGVD